MGKKDNLRMTAKELLKKGIPAVLIPGILLAAALGFRSKQLDSVNDYHAIKTIFPDRGVVRIVEDGDTFILQNGVRVRMIGINAPDRGDDAYNNAQQFLEGFVGKQTVYLEYDRYQDDKYGRVLAWVWIGCEKNPRFLPADYMHLSYNRSRPGLTDNPEGCTNGMLANEEMVRAGYAKPETYKERGELKYEKRIAGDGV